MTTYYSVGCPSEKAHICDMCESDDGRPTLYWEKKDFDLCFQCLERSHEYRFHQFTAPVIIPLRITVSESLRNKIYERDGYKCLACGCTTNLSLDHIIPFSKGGKTESDNLQTLCKSCNSRKGNR